MSRISPAMSTAFKTLILGVAGLCVMIQPAFAQQTLGQMSDNVFSALLPVQTFLSLLSYILGVFFSITGLQKLRAYVDDPGRNPLGPALLRLVGASFFVFAPTAASMLIGTISGGDTGLVNMKNAINPNSTGDGLDGALNRFVYNFAAPFLDNLLPFFAYAAGVILMLIGLKRLALADGNGPQAPGGMGTMTTFFVAAGLMAFGYIMFTLQGSIFGSTEMISNPLVKSVTNSALEERTNQALWGIFIFLRVVGYISVARALFMLRAAGEGQNVSMMAVSTHFIAGALLANGTAFILAVQETFVSDPSNYVLK